MSGEDLRRLSRQLPGWKIVREDEDAHHIQKSFLFPDFRTGLDFVNRVGEVAEEQGHHPDLHVRWGAVGVEVWTHKIDGLTESDFYFAAKCDRALIPA